MESEPDFGAVHGRTYPVKSRGGTIAAAFYEAGTWWEGHSDEPRRHQLRFKPTGLADALIAALEPKT